MVMVKFILFFYLDEVIFNKWLNVLNEVFFFLYELRVFICMFFVLVVKNF